MPVYAQIKNGTPTGVHKSFATAPADKPDEQWGLVIYGVRNPVHDPITQMVRAHRTLAEDGTVLYEELVEELPLETVKANKLKSLQQEYDTILAQGYPVPDRDFTLALKKDDRDAFTAWATNMSVALNMGAIVDTADTTLADINRMPHVMTINEAFTILMGYGAYYQAQWVRIANANAAIQAAADKTAVLGVTL